MKVSFLIPCYNEEKIIKGTYSKLKARCEALKLDYEIIIEQDGSTDRTGEIIDGIAKQNKRVTSLSFPQKHGKGWGLFEAFEASKGGAIVFLDADAPFDLSHLAELLGKLKGFDIVIASRYAGKERKLPLMRVLASRSYNMINRLLFHIKVRDTQSSMQLFKRKVLERVGSWSGGFDYNIEILAKVKKMGFKTVEVGVPYEHRSGVRFSIAKDGVGMLINTMKLFTKV